MPTFCENNQGAQRPFGGTIQDSKEGDETHQHLALMASNWRQAFDSQTVSTGAYVKFLDFDLDLIRQLANQPDCTAIRIFPGFDESGKFSVCVAGVTESSDKSLADDDKRIELFVEDKMKICCCPKNGKSKFLESLL
jgi:hypothetical protein